MRIKSIKVDLEGLVNEVLLKRWQSWPLMLNCIALAPFYVMLHYARRKMQMTIRVSLLRLLH